MARPPPRDAHDRSDAEIHRRSGGRCGAAADPSRLRGAGVRGSAECRNLPPCRLHADADRGGAADRRLDVSATPAGPAQGARRRLEHGGARGHRGPGLDRGRDRLDAVPGRGVGPLVEGGRHDRARLAGRRPPVRANPHLEPLSVLVGPRPGGAGDGRLRHRRHRQARRVPGPRDDARAGRHQPRGADLARGRGAGGAGAMVVCGVPGGRRDGQCDGGLDAGRAGGARGRRPRLRGRHHGTAARRSDHRGGGGARAAARPGNPLLARPAARSRHCGDRRYHPGLGGSHAGQRPSGRTWF